MTGCFRSVFTGIVINNDKVTTKKANSEKIGRLRCVGADFSKHRNAATITSNNRNPASGASFVTKYIPNITAAIPARSNFDNALNAWLPSSCHTGSKLNKFTQAANCATAAKISKCVAR